MDDRSNLRDNQNIDMPSNRLQGCSDNAARNGNDV